MSDCECPRDGTAVLHLFDCPTRIRTIEARVVELEGALREAASRRCFPLTPRGDAYCDELSREMLDRWPAPELLSAEEVIQNRRCASCIARAALNPKPGDKP